MKMLAINPISFKKRMKEFLFDYLFILAYLALLFIGSMLFYIIFFNGIPEFTEIQSQCLAFFTSVIPGRPMSPLLTRTPPNSKPSVGLSLVA